ncbi:ribonuclease Z [Geobacter sulfurreducens]|jgi:ribonuclease Z|uniref:Ribonuclease Z-related hydrolase n=1 Tax=Geobacter sulfurreducens (strain ATCC 51573 / DSM 12127 / PCA) TaxID=243231 RepID=Q74GW0_GEOSL|nr:MBL fold metallo-hydrolase [Geobacter sulfurreducens]AAR33469.1 ribonuclease Z-related hydrolase [Geobacter sulfurreducens PCA]ADI82973.1 ribonuclease Z-related hydrolase [Geobacter sulfurreducens KN400]AJY69871.1 ribonuclease Z [Geobacter sulfurreducens]UAC04235.1 MBL fold metallo-hydrolase [Geobacter sulfurreducens]HCD97015.1 ribonuclease Z [Geobacter sulfurreducens]
MKSRLPFRYLEPTFCAGLLDDPVLLVNVRPLGRSILVDCGQIHHLAKRVLKSIDAVFVSHAHMDHFMGLDTLVRHIHVSPRTVELFGPPGIARKVAAKLAGYDWNLTESYWCTFRVSEVHPERIVRFTFPGSEGFPCLPEEETTREGTEIFRNDFLAVDADLCDHNTLPTLVFRITERPTFWIDEAKVDQEGLVPGEWLRELKHRFYRGRLDGKTITVPVRTAGDTVAQRIREGRELFEAIRRSQEPASIGYLTDIGAGDTNLATVRRLLAGVTLLACECSFLAADVAKARTSHHLCTADVSALAREIRPGWLLPMHLSKSYNTKGHLLYRELTLAPETRLIRLPEHLTPRPLLPGEFPGLWKIAE